MRHPEILDDVTLYDVMYEAGTRYGGTIVALWNIAEEQGNRSEANRLRDDNLALQRERQAIDPHDRASMIAAYDKWTHLAHELRKPINERKTEYAA